jgi:hypothetical protein
MRHSSHIRLLFCTRGATLDSFPAHQAHQYSLRNETSLIVAHRTRSILVLSTLAVTLIGCGGSGGGGDTPPPSPSIASLSPSSVTMGSPDFTLTVSGSNFASGSSVLWNGAARSTTFVSAAQVTAQIAAADIATAGTASVSVQNSGGAVSGNSTFTIAVPPAPTISNISPQSTLVGSAPFTLTVNGTNYLSTSLVTWNGASRATTFVSATQLAAQITAADVVTAGTASVLVKNPANASSATTFTVANPLPTLASISPSTAVVGSAALTITVNGSNFVNGAQISWNGVALSATTFISSTQVTSQVPATYFATAGAADIAVTNPTPGGGTSPNLTFTVTNPVPVLSSLSPSSADVGSAAITLGANGSGFVSTSQVLWNGAACTTTYVSATQLTADISAVDLATAGSAKVSVTTSASGGGTSASLPFGIDNPLPVLLSIVQPA